MIFGSGDCIIGEETKIRLIPVITFLVQMYVCTADLSQTCFSQPNCQGDIVQPGVVTTARGCCAETNEGMSFSKDFGTTCVVQQCIRKTLNSLVCVHVNYQWVRSEATNNSMKEIMDVYAHMHVCDTYATLDMRLLAH